LTEFEMQGVYDLVRTRASLSSGAIDERRLERNTGRLSWRSEKRPGLALQAERRLVQDPAKAGDEELFTHVDWSKTLAYAIGLNGVRQLGANKRRSIQLLA